MVVVANGAGFAAERIKFQAVEPDAKINLLNHYFYLKD